MPWILLSIAVVIEIAWATSLKATDGYTRLWPSVLNFSLGLMNLYVLSQVFRVLPTGTAYAIWTGLGAVGVAIVAIFIYGESSDPLRLLCMGLIFAGVIGLRLVTPN